MNKQVDLKLSEISNEELALIRKLALAGEEKELFWTEKELFKKLTTRSTRT